jgi:hypothetical protein
VVVLTVGVAHVEPHAEIAKEGLIVVLSPTGEVLNSIPVPAAEVTGLAFSRYITHSDCVCVCVATISHEAMLFAVTGLSSLRKHPPTACFATSREAAIAAFNGLFFCVWFLIPDKSQNTKYID